ncbi:MAG TPA: MauE/DoxX family redox-associated membrane protein [Oceanipulchritudo sp.]|nr:MauE/DoxX family redox-associated membrane protein [Oceanipulchritudo sp.]
MKIGLERLLLAILSLFFLYAGGSKLVDPHAFSLAIERYHLVDGLAAHLLAFWLPWVECVAALFLWPRRWRLAAAAVLGGLMLVFQVALTMAFVRGLDIDCGCLGEGLEMSVTGALLRNFFILLLLLWVARLNRHER